MKMRIQKFLSEQGIMSRREAEDAIDRGWIKLNGKKVVDKGTKMDPDTDKLELHEEAQKSLKEKITVAVYKPRGVLSSKDTEGKNVFDVFKKHKDLNTVGRLDKESEGLLLLSNDGMVTKAVTGKDHLTEKEYIVKVREDVLPWMIKKMETGIKLKDGMTLPTKAKKIDKHTFNIILREGRNHQIRRMADYLHLTVKSLKRIRVGNIKIDRLRSGNSRKLSKKEVAELKNV